MNENENDFWQTRTKCKFTGRSMCDDNGKTTTKVSASSSRRNFSLLLFQFSRRRTPVKLSICARRKINGFSLPAPIFKTVLWPAKLTSQKWCLITKSKDVAGKYSISIIWMTKTDDSIVVCTVRKYLFSDWLAWEMKISSYFVLTDAIGKIIRKKGEISSTEEVSFVW